MLQYLMMTLLILTSSFLIIVVLIQRGRGGGLAGAFGGMGGQSAFGTKAGDLFTRITIGVAGFWIALSILAVILLHQEQSLIDPNLGTNPPAKAASGATGGKAAPASGAATKPGSQATSAGPAEKPTSGGETPAGGTPAAGSSLSGAAPQSSESEKKK